MPLQWANGWLVRQMQLLEADPDRFWSQPFGFIDDTDPEFDPWTARPAEPPAGVEKLPFYDAEKGVILDGE